MIRALIERVSGYPGLFLFCVTSGLVLPLPEDVSLLYAGAQVLSGEMAWPMTLAVSLAGVMVRDVIAYWIGRSAGGWLLHRNAVVRFIGAKRLRRAETLVNDHGERAIFVGRFLVGLRAPVFFVAGAMGVGFRKFLIWNSLGLLIAVPGVVLLGYWFGEPLAEGALWFARHARVVMGSLMFAVGVWVIWWVRSRPEEVPLAEQGQVPPRSASEL